MSKEATKTEYSDKDLADVVAAARKGFNSPKLKQLSTKLADLDEQSSAVEGEILYEQWDHIIDIYHMLEHMGRKKHPHKRSTVAYVFGRALRKQKLTDVANWNDSTLSNMVNYTNIWMAKHTAGEVPTSIADLSNFGGKRRKKPTTKAAKDSNSKGPDSRTTDTYKSDVEDSGRPTEGAEVFSKSLSKLVAQLDDARVGLLTRIAGVLVDHRKAEVALIDTSEEVNEFIGEVTALVEGLEAGAEKSKAVKAAKDSK